jgi:hypothetical protein
VLRISKRPEPVNIVHCSSCIRHEPFSYSRRHCPTPKNTLRGNPGCAVGPKTPTAMDEGTPLGGLEFENDAEPSHGLHAVLSSLWGRGYLAHRLRIRIPEDEGIRRPKQPNQLRRLTGPAGGGSAHGLTTLDAVSVVPATLPRPRGSDPRPLVGRLGASATTRRPRAPQAHASLRRAIHHHQDFEARNIQAGQQSR